ncbi:MAG: hypothetical protein OET90_02905 [Desulfuromonadales bacterium]|nr:hypothetical protein [Desulfuromonadales bacterium]
MAKQVVTTKERTVRTYTEMWHTSDCLLSLGQENPEGSYHQFMGSLVFTAFTLEAYLNHAGEKLFQCWSDLERLGPKEKLNVIAEHIGLEVNYGGRPWQVIKDLFGFRNDIAHGKTVEINKTEKVPLHKHTEEEGPLFTPTRWEKYCCEQNAVRAREDVEKIVHLIHEASGIQDEHPFDHGMQVWTSSLVEV